MPQREDPLLPQAPVRTAKMIRRRRGRCLRMRDDQEGCAEGGASEDGEDNQESCAEGGAYEDGKDDQEGCAEGGAYE